MPWIHWVRVVYLSEGSWHLGTNIVSLFFQFQTVESSFCAGESADCGHLHTYSVVSLYTDVRESKSMVGVIFVGLVWAKSIRR